jgi:type IV secretory pathway TrbL component
MCRAKPVSFSLLGIHKKLQSLQQISRLSFGPEAYEAKVITKAWMFVAYHVYIMALIFMIVSIDTHFELFSLQLYVFCFSYKYIF